MEAAHSVRQVLLDVRVADPAVRDQDGEAWRRGRFEERVRREWNPIRTERVGRHRQEKGYDLGALAQEIQKAMGGDLDAIVGRLWTFWEMEFEGRPPADDPLVRPGAPA